MYEIPTPLFPLLFFVVIITTPLPARLPYKAAAAGPFNTDMLSISSGDISEMPEPLSTRLLPHISAVELLKLSIGTPSTTMSGWLFPLMELFPRIKILVEPPTPVPFCRICTPATFPASEFATLASRVSVSFSPFTSCMA
ncbi:hypothetical protein Barb7_03119 [Bacteroidales bacterium Barb7]|nr:hypothetical protein Barb7_03119 [Bacteroidales bacterium Barb7]